MIAWTAIWQGREGCWEVYLSSEVLSGMSMSNAECWLQDANDSFSSCGTWSLDSISSTAIWQGREACWEVYLSSEVYSDMCLSIAVK